jgi:hypothetical protein
VDYEENTELEFLYSYQGTELKPDGHFTGESFFGLGVHYIHFGGTYFWNYDWAKPFVASTIGVTLLDPHPGGLDSEVFFSLSIGGAVFCGEGGCGATIKSDVLLQFEFRAGLICVFKGALEYWSVNWNFFRLMPSLWNMLRIDFKLGGINFTEFKAGG